MGIERVEITYFQNRDINEWIRNKYGDNGSEREAAFATVRFLSERYPELKSVLCVTTVKGETKEG